MLTPVRKSIPMPSPQVLARVVERHPSSLWLDSAALGHSRARYSLLVTDPLGILTINQEGHGCLEWNGEKRILDDPYFFLDRYLHEVGAQLANGEKFCGGVAGFLSYESYGQRERQQPRFHHPWVPDAWFLLFDSGLWMDHAENRAELFSLGLTSFDGQGNADIAFRRIQALEEQFTGKVSAEAPLQINSREFPPADFYHAKVEEIRRALLRGDCYQVNFAQPFRFNGVWSAGDLYLKFRASAPAPHMAFINGGDFQILSGSPETFFEIEGDRIRTYPIKGTRPRGRDKAGDAQNRLELLNSEKDQAELLMIVDLMRNDLGRCCSLGSIKVPQFRVIESFPQVHHAMACIEGRLSSQVTALQALRMLSPGGSITGAPKLKAMQFINELEEAPRGVYTGSIGFVGFEGRAVFNLCIRTATLCGSRLEYWAGGGIVVDSDSEAEYRECLAKAQGFLNALKVNLP